MLQIRAGILCCVAVVSSTLPGSASSLTFRVSDESGDPLPCRIHLSRDSGEPVLAPGYPAWRDHFVCDGNVTFSPAPGRFRFEIERGPEYVPVTGDVVLTAEEDLGVTVTLKRLTSLRQSGWFSGDLHVHRPPADVPLLMSAEDLDVAPVITWWNQQNVWRDLPLPTTTLTSTSDGRVYDLMGGEDEREGGALLFFGLPDPLPITAATREYPSPLTYVDQARERYPDVHIDIEKPFWWDVPLWVASGRIDSIGIANNHMCRSQMLENEAWGFPRDTRRLPGPLGNGLWTQEIYYHLLNSGIRMPPSAGSASGVLPNPVGYNRVYVHLDGALDWNNWWEGLRAGRSFVTNGPLLLCSANGMLPGHVFRPDDDSATIDVEFSVTSNDPVDRVEVIRNGEIIWTGSGSPTGTCQLTFDRSGWFLVRAMTANPRTFRFASTAPWFVEAGNDPDFLSRRSVQFFLDWLAERRDRVPLKLQDPKQLAEVLKYHDEALRFWQQRLAQVNAE